MWWSTTAWLTWMQESALARLQTRLMVSMSSRFLWHILRLPVEFENVLPDHRFEELGALLKESHQSLRDDFEVSTPNVDRLVETASSTPGCLGARIMGAGFGGSVLALVERGREAALIDAVGRPVIVCSTADGAFVSGR